MIPPFPRVPLKEQPRCIYVPQYEMGFGQPEGSDVVEARPVRRRGGEQRPKLLRPSRQRERERPFPKEQRILVIAEPIQHADRVVHLSAADVKASP